MTCADDDAAKEWLRANHPDEPALPDTERTGAERFVLIGDDILENVDSGGRLPPSPDDPASDVLAERAQRRSARELGRFELQESVPLRSGRPHAVDVTLTVSSTRPAAKRSRSRLRPASGRLSASS